MYSSGADFYSHSIDQSLRFEDSDDAYLARTFGTPTNNKKWTYSVWMKRGNLGTNQAIMSADYDGSNYWDIRFNTSDQIYIQNRIGASNLLIANTTAVFRDVSAWYNIVFVFDSDNATASNRAILYVNGVSQTLSASPSSGDASGYNVSGEPHHIGVSRTLSSSGGIWSEFDGYQAEINFIDGQALSATSFGETKAGIWIPKNTSGLTFGNNGFRLKFQDSSALGDDTSGNGNDFSTNGLAATDVVLDSPTNNFATMNSVDPCVGTSVTLSQGNLKAVGKTSSYSGGVASTFEFESGKWYWEVGINNEVTAGSNYYSFVGAATGEPNDVHRLSSSGQAIPSLGSAADGWSWEGDGTINLRGTGTKAVSSVSAPSAGDILGFAMDLDNGNVYFYLNGTAQNSGSAVITGVTGLKTNPMVGLYNSSGVTFNFGQDSSFAGTETAQGNADGNGKGDFYYSPPSGFLALCSANLPNPGIDPAEDEEPADYFNTVLWTGNDVNDRSVTGVGFQPDWVWIKNRAVAEVHNLYDVIRGAGQQLYSNSTDDEFDRGIYGLKSFTSDGFTLGTGGEVNDTSETYVAWNWLAGGSAVTNNEGSIQSSVSANTEAGFSIVSYTGTASADTVGHGLSQAPELVIWKDRETAVNWLVQGDAMGAATSGYIMLLNSTGSSYANSNFNTTLGASTITLDAGGTNYNGSGKDTIAYCFHSVDGYSKIGGSYTGNGSSDGPFVYTGFRVAWVMIKRTDSAADWIIFDNKRDVHNELTKFLYPNLGIAEAAGSGVMDFLSNGFKLRGSTANRNASGGTYIYLAFAEQPFKYSNAR